MARWSWVLGDAAPSDVEFRELTKAKSRRVTWRVDGPADAAFSIDGRSDEAAEITALATDLHVYRDGVKLLRGRIGAEQDDITPSAHTTQFGAVDYRGMLAYRQVGPAGASYVGIDQGVIAFDLIDTSQDLTGGDWGVTDGLGSTSGTLRDRTGILPGSKLLDLITSLGQVDNGFEWEVDPALALNRWYPRRGDDNGVVLDYGGLLTSARRVLNPADFANVALVTGSDETVPVEEVAGDVGTDPRGRWEVSQSFPSIVDQGTLDDRAVWVLGESSTLKPDWVVQFTLGRWGGPDHVWLGDIVTLAVRSGRLAVNAAHRVVELSVALDEAGRETVSAGLLAEPAA